MTLAKYNPRNSEESFSHFDDEDGDEEFVNDVIIFLIYILTEVAPYILALDSNAL